MGKSGWFSGHQSCLLPLWPRFNSGLGSYSMWAEFQSISTWLRGFFSGYSGFPPSSKSTPSQLHLAGFAVLREHTWIKWRQPWAPSHAFSPIPLSQLILKSPCRDWSTKRTFIFTFTFTKFLGMHAGSLSFPSPSPPSFSLARWRESLLTDYQSISLATGDSVGLSVTDSIRYTCTYEEVGGQTKSFSQSSTSIDN